MSTLFLLLTGFTIGLFSGIGLIYVLRHRAENLEHEYPEVFTLENEPFDNHK
jgi:hypothetical protein